MKMIRAHVIISGIVQGVFFRANTIEKAKSLGLKGWVRNTNNNVEAVFEGSDDKVKKIVEWCREGPKGASVNHVEVEYKNYVDEFGSFEMR